MPEAKVIKVHNSSGNPVYIRVSKIEVFLDHTSSTTLAKIRVANTWSNIKETSEEVLTLIEGKKIKRGPQFVKPTLEEVTAYCDERKNNVDPSHFINHYDTKGWVVGKTKMKNWKACIGTWEAKDKEMGNGSRGSAQSFRESQEGGFSDIGERIQV